MRLTLTICAMGLLMACGHPQTLQYDHGRAYHEAMAVQADRDRESASDAVYTLTGEEALRIRILVTESATNADNTSTTLDLQTN